MDPKVVLKKPVRKTKVKPTRDAIVAERSVLKANLGKRKVAPIIDTEPEEECVRSPFYLYMCMLIHQHSIRPSKKAKPGRPSGLIPVFRTPAQLRRANSSESNQSAISISSTDAYPIIRGNGTIRGLARNEETIANLDNVKYGGYGMDEDESTERMAAFRATSKAVKVEGKKKVRHLVLHFVVFYILLTSSYRNLLPLYPMPPLIA